jgi:hypothetical protein
MLQSEYLAPNTMAETVTIVSTAIQKARHRQRFGIGAAP